MGFTTETAEITEDLREFNKITDKIIGLAIEVHKKLGPGLLESAYEACLTFELSQSGLFVERQKPLPIIYKGLKLDCGYRLDLVVENKIIVELKSIEQVEPIHKAQLLSYLKLSEYRLGLLINFNVKILKSGIFRLINN